MLSVSCNGSQVLTGRHFVGFKSVKKRPLSSSPKNKEVMQMSDVLPPHEVYFLLSRQKIQENVHI